MRSFAGLYPALMIIVLVLSGCIEDAGENNGNSTPAFVTEVHMETAGGERQEQFNAGEDVVVVAEVRNRRDSEQILEFATERVSDFVVLDDTDQVRRLWSDDRAFAEVLTEEAFAPGETRRFEMTWQGLDDASGVSLEPGEYEIQAWLPADDARDGVDELSPEELRSVLVRFEIE